MKPAFRFSEAQFRRFEPLIHRVLERWPHITEVDPSHMNLSLETFTCRFRDAVRGCLTQGYRSTLFDTRVLSDIKPDLVVCTHGTRVLIGPRKEMRVYRAVPLAATSTKAPAPNVHVLRNPPREEFFAFCTLLSIRRLDKPLLCVGLDPAMLTEALDKFDIDATHNPDGSVLIL